jgi:hypothetical protein
VVGEARGRGWEKETIDVLAGKGRCTVIIRVEDGEGADGKRRADIYGGMSLVRIGLHRGIETTQRDGNEKKKCQRTRAGRDRSAHSRRLSGRDVDERGRIGRRRRNVGGRVGRVKRIVGECVFGSRGLGRRRAGGIRVGVRHRRNGGGLDGWRGTGDSHTSTIAVGVGRSAKQRAASHVVDALAESVARMVEECRGRKELAGSVSTYLSGLSSDVSDEEGKDVLATDDELRSLRIPTILRIWLFSVSGLRTDIYV